MARIMGTAGLLALAGGGADAAGAGGGPVQRWGDGTSRAVEGRLLDVGRTVVRVETGDGESLVLRTAALTPDDRAYLDACRAAAGGTPPGDAVLRRVYILSGGAVRHLRDAPGGARAALAARSIDFPPGTGAELDAAQRRLSVAHHWPGIGRIEAVLLELAQLPGAYRLRLTLYTVERDHARRLQRALPSSREAPGDQARALERAALVVDAMPGRQRLWQRVFDVEPGRPADGEDETDGLRVDASCETVPVQGEGCIALLEVTVDPRGVSRRERIRESLYLPAQGARAFATGRLRYVRPGDTRRTAGRRGETETGEKVDVGLVVELAHEGLVAVP